MKGSPLAKPSRRRLEIAELVAREGRQSVDDLADAFGVSAETIRRDLASLAAEGLVQKVHGGARLPRLHAEATFRERMAEDAAGKHAVAAALREIVQPGEVIFVDTGSTTLVAALKLATIEGLTVITNSYRIAEVLDRGGTRVFLLGGRYRASDGQTIGSMAIEAIGRFQADTALITVAAINTTGGAMDSDFDEAEIARAMIARARRTVVLATRSKMERRAAFSVCPLHAVDTLLTDTPPAGPLGAALSAADVEVIVADGEVRRHAA